MSHHEYTSRTVGQLLLQPFYHFDVEVVGGFVKHEHVGLGDEDVGQCDTFDWSSRQFADALVEVVDFQSRQHLLNPLLVFPRFQVVHLVEQTFQSRVAFSLYALLVVSDEVGHFVSMPETRLHDRQFRRV